jgi:hypothetical protein
LRAFTSSTASCAVPTVVEVVLHRGHHQPQVVFGHQIVPEPQDLLEVVAGVHVQQGERHRRWPERLQCEMDEQRGILATGEQDHRAVEFPRHLPEDVDSLRLQRVQVIHSHHVVLPAEARDGAIELWCDRHTAPSP